MDKSRIEFGEVRIGDQARNNLMAVCDTNWVSAGPMVKEFESKWNKLFGYKHSVAMSSGTDAVINACLALYDLKGAVRGVSEVIVPALSFISTANGVRAAGLVPVFVDVKCSTLNIDEHLIEGAINSKTVAVMPVHTMGRVAKMDVITAIAWRHNLIVIEDTCEAYGAMYEGKAAGQWGDMALFSFYAAHLVCCGEGGMVSTNSKVTANILGSTRSHGRPFNSIAFDHQRTGLNSKMNDLEASIGLEALGVFWHTFWTRHDTMVQVRNACNDFEDMAWFSEEELGDTNCAHGFSITCKHKGDIKKVMNALEQENIHYKRNFGCIPTQHAAFADMGFIEGALFTEAEWIGDNGIHIGLHPYLTHKEKGRICHALQMGLSACQKGHHS